MAERAQEVESAMNKADTNLYSAKRGGRNRTFINPEDDQLS
jgi:PleD family two-component response regulator